VTSGKQAKALAWLGIRIVMVFLSIIGLFPFIWTVSLSFTSLQEAYTSGLGLVPRVPTLDNYRNIFTAIAGGQQSGIKYFYTLYRNSFILSVSSVLLTVIMSSLTAYAFARLDFPGRKAIFAFFIGLMFLPGGGTMVATYILMRALHLLDSIFGLILLHISAGGTALFLMRQIFLNIPQELEDAARVDGASDWRIAFQIMFPLATSGMTLIAVLTFMSVWGSYLVPSVMLRSVEKFTLPIGVYVVVNYASSAAVTRSIEFPGIRAAVMMLFVIPVLVVFVVLQKWFIRGAVEGLKL